MLAISGLAKSPLLEHAMGCATGGRVAQLMEQSPAQSLQKMGHLAWWNTTGGNFDGQAWVTYQRQGRRSHGAWGRVAAKPLGLIGDPPGLLLDCDACGQALPGTARHRCRAARRSQMQPGVARHG